MPRVRVHNLAISLDGFVAGPDQGPDDPIGAGGLRLHEWAFATRSFQRIHGGTGGETGLDDEFIARGDDGIGATVMGRNMFGPIRGDWGDGSWTGWWDPEPPFHHPVFVLTHHQRDPLEMAGGTTFHFVTDGPEAALERALDAAGGRDVRIGGGASTVAQYLRAGLIDELHLAYVPVLLGRGESLFTGVDLSATYTCAEQIASPAVTHVRIVRR
ncbi:MAG: hypothetical protein QOF53_1197 [Nocardioidaceae bacterium]|nr:hypothetical protein [Nocardioidaceae bacterium]